VENQAQGEAKNSENRDGVAGDDRKDDEAA
jgi:hypothetical protein